MRADGNYGVRGQQEFLCAGKDFARKLGLGYSTDIGRDVGLWSRCWPKEWTGHDVSYSPAGILGLKKLVDQVKYSKGFTRLSVVTSFWFLKCSYHNEDAQTRPDPLMPERLWDVFRIPL